MKKRYIFLLLLLVIISDLFSQTVYTTKTGEKYHLENCQYLRYSRIETTLNQALDFGYDPCSICKPPRTKTDSVGSKAIKQENKNNTRPASTNTRRAVAVQCSGRTKAGNRCKRRTKNASGRCYQH